MSRVYYAGTSLGVCPAGGEHALAGSGDYILRDGEPGFGQNNWRWCNKCQGLYYAGTSLGVCPAGGEHALAGSGDYDLEQQ